MSNGNLDNSAPSVGVLKLQITRPKHRGLEPKWTSPRWVIIAISRSTSHPRKLVTEKRAAPTAGPLGSTRPSPSDTCSVIWTKCAHLIIRRVREMAELLVSCDPVMGTRGKGVWAPVGSASVLGELGCSNTFPHLSNEKKIVAPTAYNCES